jgi:GT2 family glycosyltransferase
MDDRHPPEAEPESSRRALARAVTVARLELAADEEENSRAHAELALIKRSAGLRLLGSLKPAAERMRHPLWSGGTLARRALAQPVFSRSRAIGRRLLVRSQPLRILPSAHRWTDAHDQDEAIRWLGPLRIRHSVMDALLCQPDSGVEYQLAIVSGASFVCGCAIAPDTWHQNPAAVEFSVEIRDTASSWTRTASLTVDASDVRHRRWHPLRVALPASADGHAQEVVVTLSTRAAGVAGREAARAIFGEPRFEWRRSATEVWRSVTAFASRARTGGVRDALRLATQAAGPREEEGRYALWVQRNTPSAEALASMAQAAGALAFQPLISVITPVYNTDPKWLRACIESVRRQAYPRWELCLCDDASTSSETVAVLREYEQDPRIKVTYLKENARISGATNAALALASGDFVALLDHDDELTPDALFHVASFLAVHRDADMVYSDEDKLDLASQRCDPYFKPDWSPDHFLNCMYTCHLMVVRRTALEQVGGFRAGYEGAQDYDLVLRLMEKTGRIHHIPRVLYHWRKLPESTASAGQAKPWALDAGRLAVEDYVKRNGLDAEVLPGAAPGLFRVKRAIKGSPLVSIVIPTAGRLRQDGHRQVDLVAACVRSVAQTTRYPHWELVLVADPAGLQPTTTRALEGVRHRIITYTREGTFNFSGKVNAGVAASTGEHVVLFNDDLEVISPDWLSAMLEYSQDPAIGAVGARLLYPDGRLQHVGMILGVGGIAAHAFHQHSGSAPGYASGAVSVRNYSAITGACLMSRRAVFDEIGGFDEHFPIDFNDVDYCLRLRRAGYRIVYTPYAQLYHHESASFGPRVQDPAGIAEMRRRWGAVLDADPYYNPNLTRDFPDYRLG